MPITQPQVVQEVAVPAVRRQKKQEPQALQIKVTKAETVPPVLI
jgi:hypothetical protein